MKEIYVAIKGYDGIYEVSNLGNVRSVDREIKMSHGGIKFQAGRILKQVICSSGYYKVNLYDENRKQRTCRVHTLVATHFIDNPNKYNFVNHYNEDKLDSQVENLFWTNQVENNSRGGSISHKVRKGA